MSLKGKFSSLWKAIFVLVAALSLPTLGLADPPQGRGHGRHKKDVFVNGHDASEGRWDKGGPKYKKNKNKHKDRDDWDDRDDRDDRSRRRRDRDNDGINDRVEIRRQASSIGYREGFRAGQDDRASGRSYDVNAHNTYRDATVGYRDSYGDIEFYRHHFREGYRRGYEDGYNNRRSRRSSSRAGDILGDIFGRP